MILPDQDLWLRWSNLGWVRDVLDTLGLGKTASTAQQNWAFWQLPRLWIWSDFGCTTDYMVKSLLLNIIWLNIIGAATATRSQPARLSTRGSFCPWVQVMGPTTRMTTRTWVSACLLTPELHTRLWEHTSSTCAQQDHPKQRMCPFSAAHCYPWDLLMSF